MKRSSVNVKEVFREATDAYARDFEAGLKQRRHEMENAWEEIDEGWAALETKMAKFGFRPAESADDSILKLNVGGAPVDLWRSSLTESEYARQSKLGYLFNGVWDKRLPTTSNGRIVLDESPSCFKYIMNSLLNRTRSSARQGTFSLPKESNVEVLDTCNEAYMNSLECFLGLDLQVHKRQVQAPEAKEAKVTSDGRKILVGTEGKNILHQLKSWLVNGKSTEMSLFYQASRDGFTPDSFHKCCDGAGSTVTLFEVSRHLVTSRVVLSVDSWVCLGPRY